jgi:hypothetical protein
MDKLNPTTSHEGDISWILSDSNLNNYQLVITKEEYLKNTMDVPAGIKYLETNNGSIIAVNDYVSYIQSISQFRDLADEIYMNSDNDYEFVRNVWYLVTRSVEYADEDLDTISLPLQTLLDNQGDCEDLTILMASILVSSSYTHDWTIEIVYLDAFNPDDPKTANHVALYIQTDEFSTFVESTNSDLNGLDVWRNVNGWYISIPRL